MSTVNSRSSAEYLRPSIGRSVAAVTWAPTYALLTGCVLVGFLAMAVAISGSVVVEPESDELVFARAAARIASTGDLNPHWFGHPGATVIYPMALVLRLAYGPELQRHTAGNVADMILFGRGLSIAYELLALVMLFLVGKRMFETATAIVATWLIAIVPIAVAHAQVVRTDSAGLFFSLLTVWLCLRLVDQPTPKRAVFTGAAFGMAIATRYFMVGLVPVLVASALLTRAGRHASLRVRLGQLMLAGLAAALSFTVTSPFAILDLPELHHSLRNELKPTHPGADGLSPLGNFAWYLTSALPDDLTWPIALLAAIGVVIAVSSRRSERLLPLSYVVLHIVLISTPPQHWHRWIIQVLPFGVLYCAFAIRQLAAHLPMRRTIAGVAVALVSIQPAYQLLTFDMQQLQPAPRQRAREWIVGNLPRGMRLAVEGYGPPLAGLGYSDTTMFTLAEPGGADDYAARGYQYLVVSSAVFDRYFAEPRRYAAEVQFYADLFTRGRLAAEFTSPIPNPELFALIAGAECNCALHPTRGGPSVRIYAL